VLFFVSLLLVSLPLYSFAFRTMLHGLKLSTGPIVSM
jgi:hypothetical protein